MKEKVKSLKYNQCNHLSVIKIIAIPTKSNFSLMLFLVQEYEYVEEEERATFVPRKELFYTKASKLPFVLFERRRRKLQVAL